jgi:electron transfer flavoprotein alpha subunit
MAKLWVFAEVSAAGPDPAALEILTKARELSGEVDAVALGPGAGEAAPVLAAHGAATVFASDDPVYAECIAQPAAHALYGLVREHSPELIVFATNYDSRDVAGRLSAKLRSTLVSNVTDILAPDLVRTAIFGGTTFVDVELRGTPKLVLVRPKSFEARPLEERPREGDGRVVQVGVDVPEELCRARRVERHDEPASGPKLEDASVVVSGGRGLKEAANFRLLDELAGAIGDAAVGATRAVVDSGWVPYAYQIGQTGTTIKPNLYLAFGISGATQHVVGMKGAKKIVAVNKDDEAPILQIADLGVVGDALKILPQLIEEVKARTGR